MVVLSFLDSGLHAARTRIEVERNFLARVHDLSDFGYRERGGRMDFVVADPARRFRKCGAKIGHVDLRYLRSADCHDLSRVGAVAGDPVNWAGCSSAPGIFSESIYANFGSLPFPGRWIGCGNWRNDRSDRGNLNRRNRGTRSAMDEQLHDSVFHCRVSVLGGATRDSSAEPQTRAGRNRAGMTK